MDPRPALTPLSPSPPATDSTSASATTAKPAFQRSSASASLAAIAQGLVPPPTLAGQEAQRQAEGAALGLTQVESRGRRRSEAARGQPRDMVNPSGSGAGASGGWAQAETSRQGSTSRTPQQSGSSWEHRLSVDSTTRNSGPGFEVIGRPTYRANSEDLLRVVKAGKEGEGKGKERRPSTAHSDLTSASGSGLGAGAGAGAGTERDKGWPSAGPLEGGREAHWLGTRREPINDIVVTDKLTTSVTNDGQRIVNDYVRIKVLGKGCHGTVWLCEDMRAVRDGRLSESEQYCAIKTVYRQDRRDRSLRKSQAHRRFAAGSAGGFDPRHLKPALPMDHQVRSEIAIMKRCNHPHVVRLKEVIDDARSKKIFMVLEYMAGGSLKWQSDEETQEPTMTVAQARKVFMDVVSGLQYLHAQGIIHRDIKPANLLWDRDHTLVKISDFGVSHLSEAMMRQNDDGSTAPPTSGSGPTQIDDKALRKTAGSPAFFAPELCVMSESTPPIRTPDTVGSGGDYFPRVAGAGTGGSGSGSGGATNGRPASLRTVTTISSPVRSPGPLGPLTPRAPGQHLTAQGQSAKPTRPPIGKAIDVWAAGVTLYCLLFGRLPFQALTEYELYNIIPRQTAPILEFVGADRKRTMVGEGMTDEERSEARELVDLLSRLLDKDPTRRIKLSEVKSHPWVLRGVSDETQRNSWLNTDSNEKVIITPAEVEQATTTRSASRSMLRHIGGIRGTVKRAAEKLGITVSSVRSHGSATNDDLRSTSALRRRRRKESISSASAYTSTPGDGLSEPAGSRVASRQPSVISRHGGRSGTGATATAAASAAVTAAAGLLRNRSPSPSTGSRGHGSPGGTHGRKWSLRSPFMGRGMQLPPEPTEGAPPLERTTSATSESATSSGRQSPQQRRKPPHTLLQLPITRRSELAASPGRSELSHAMARRASYGSPTHRPLSPNLPAEESDSTSIRAPPGTFKRILDRIKSGSRTPSRNSSALPSPALSASGTMSAATATARPRRRTLGEATFHEQGLGLEGTSFAGYGGAGSPSRTDDSPRGSERSATFASRSVDAYNGSTSYLQGYTSPLSRAPRRELPSKIDLARDDANSDELDLSSDFDDDGEEEEGYGPRWGDVGRGAGVGMARGASGDSMEEEEEEEHTSDEGDGIGDGEDEEGHEYNEGHGWVKGPGGGRTGVGTGPGRPRKGSLSSVEHALDSQSSLGGSPRDEEDVGHSDDEEDARPRLRRDGSIDSDSRRRRYEDSRGRSYSRPRPLRDGSIPRQDQSDDEGTYDAHVHARPQGFPEDDVDEDDEDDEGERTSGSRNSWKRWYDPSQQQQSNGHGQYQSSNEPYRSTSGHSSRGKGHRLEAGTGEAREEERERERFADAEHESDDEGDEISIVVGPSRRRSRMMGASGFLDDKEKERILVEEATALITPPDV